jgi:hypothetical protein
MMRVYLHYLGPPEHTKVFRELPRQGGPSISALLTAFVHEYNARYNSNRLQAEHVAAKHEGASLAGAQAAADCLADRADVYVVILHHDTDPTESGGTGHASTDAVQWPLAAPDTATPPAVAQGPGGGSASGGSDAIGRNQARSVDDTRNSSNNSSSKGSSRDSSTASPGLVVGSSSGSGNASGISGGGGCSSSHPVPEGVPGLLARAAVQQGAGQLLTAVQLYQQALQQQPQHVEASSQLASLLLEAGRVEDALDVVQVCLPADAQGWQLHTLLGDCHLALGNGALALTAFKAALSRCVQVSPGGATHSNLQRLCGLLAAMTGMGNS